MNKLILPILVLVFSGIILLACQRTDQTAEMQTFGGEVTMDESVTLADVYSNPENFVDKEIRIDGTIKEVCQKKGCWLKLTDGERELTVRFKDYGFFVPKDAAKTKVTIQGIFSMEADTHIEEEAQAQAMGKDHAEGEEHAIEETEEEHAEMKDNKAAYSFTAHSVIIYSAIKEL